VSWAAYQLIGLTALFAVWVCVHVLVVWHAFRPREEVQMSWGVRALALVPPAAPIVAWRGRHRISPIIWTVVAVGYGVLWIVSSGH
jgi:hypothetical protein